MSFNNAKKYAKKFNINSQKGWKIFYKKSLPENIPYNANLIYKKEWKGWDDFLGTGRKPRSKKR